VSEGLGVESLPAADSLAVENMSAVAAAEVLAADMVERAWQAGPLVAERATAVAGADFDLAVGLDPFLLY